MYLLVTRESNIESNIDHQVLTTCHIQKYISNDYNGNLQHVHYFKMWF